MNENKTKKNEQKKNDPADDIAHFVIVVGFFLMTNAIIFGFGFDTHEIVELNGMPNLYRTMVEKIGVDATQVVNFVVHLPFVFTLLIDAAIIGVVLIMVLCLVAFLTVLILSFPYNWLHSIVYSIVKRFVQEENTVNENTGKKTLDDLANAVNSPPDQTKRDLEKILQEAEKEKKKGERTIPEM